MRGLPSLGRKSLFLFDLDGVFYKGKESRVQLGGAKTIEAIRLRGKMLSILTNDSTDSVETVRSRLSESGVKVAADEILTSAFLTADYLRSRHGPVSYYLVGEAGLEREMSRFGHTRTEGETADFVVVGLDRSLSYEKLDHAASVVRHGAAIVATHTARLYMYRDGPAVATGPIVKALEYATGKRATVIGKPSGLMFRMALRKAQCRREDAVMIGDQVETDIAGAAHAGIDAILVTTGVDKAAGGYRLLATISHVDELADHI
ncbi:MAG TPA: HAD-IIA family hydrolase [Nitrososphaerales archaeon]|nr:HAD-IIA family hydrolase [Nitrososphaerales archaeon]